MTPKTSVRVTSKNAPASCALTPLAAKMGRSLPRSKRLKNMLLPSMFPYTRCSTTAHAARNWSRSRKLRNPGAALRTTNHLNMSSSSKPSPVSPTPSAPSSCTSPLDSHAAAPASRAKPSTERLAPRRRLQTVTLGRVGHPSQTKEGANQRLAPPLVQLPSLLLAPVAGSTTVGRIAARCIRRPHHSCKTERNHCHQHNCSNRLHGFSPLRNQIWFCRPMAMPSAGHKGTLQE